MALLLTVGVELSSVVSPRGSLFFSLVDKGNELSVLPKLCSKLGCCTLIAMMPKGVPWSYVFDKPYIYQKILFPNESSQCLPLATCAVSFQERASMQGMSSVL